jgi:hypothetical protein
MGNSAASLQESHYIDSAVYEKFVLGKQFTCKSKFSNIISLSAVGQYFNSCVVDDQQD